jgi:hypothetical protein
MVCFRYITANTLHQGDKKDGGGGGDDDDDDDDNNNKVNTSNTRGDWDYFKVIYKIREQHTRKTRSQGIPENSHIRHCTHTSESTNVKIQ